MLEVIKMFIITLTTLITTIITTLLYASVISNQYDPELVKLAKPVLNAINFERSELNQPLVKYNYNLQKELNLYSITYGTGWCFQDNEHNWVLSFPVVGNLNKTRVDNCAFLMNYSTFERVSQEGYKFLFSYSKKLKEILQKGKKCFKLRNCYKTTFSNYISCTTPIDKCNGQNVFYPRVIASSLTNIACVEDNGKNYCFGKTIENMDYPFKK